MRAEGVRRTGYVLVMSVLLLTVLLWCGANLVFVLFMNRRAHVRTRKAARRIGAPATSR